MNRTTAFKRLNTVKVRMSDAAVLAGAASLLYALVLMAFPRAFPELLARVFGWGYFFLALGVVLVGTNEILFLRISKRRSQKPDLLTAGYIAFLTTTVVFGFWLLVSAANLQTEISQLVPDPSGRARDRVGPEELLVYTFLTMVSGIFLPYLMVRVTQNYVSPAKSADDERVRNAAAGQ